MRVLILGFLFSCSIFAQSKDPPPFKMETNKVEVVDHSTMDTIIAENVTISFVYLNHTGFTITINDEIFSNLVLNKRLSTPYVSMYEFLTTDQNKIHVLVSLRETSIIFNNFTFIIQ